MISSRPKSTRLRGFTLVEMLVASAVLVILVLLLAQLLGGATAVTSSSQARISADDQARLALDRIASDLAKMTKRTDLDYYLSKDSEGQNDSLYFFSRVPGVADAGSDNDASGLSLIGYRIEDGKLKRVAKSVPWNEMTFLTYNEAGNLNGTTSMETQVNHVTNDDFHVLCNGVFRLEFGFLLKDGTFRDQPWMDRPSEDVADSDVGTRRWSRTSAEICVVDSPGPPARTIFKALGWQDVEAVVVSIAVIDEKSLTLLDQTELTRAASDLPNARSEGASDTMKFPVTEWIEKINDPDGMRLPAKAQAAVRAYQRIVYLNTP